MKKKLLITLLVSIGFYSFANAKTYTKSLEKHEISKLISVIKFAKLEKADFSIVTSAPKS